MSISHLRQPNIQEMISDLLDFQTIIAFHRYKDV